MPPAIRESPLCLLWGLLLTVVTGGLGLCGIWGWNGESGGNPLALFALPMFLGWFGTSQIAVGIVAQAVLCIGVTCLVRLRMRHRAAAVPETATAAPRSRRTHPLMIALLVIAGLIVTVYFVGF